MSDEEEQQTLGQRLNVTGAKLADLSKKAAEATKSAMMKTAEVSREAAQSATEASKKAVSKTNVAVKKAVEDNKAKREEKRDMKIQNTKIELTSQGIIDDVPPMVTLPEFENERMVVVNEQHENQLLMLEELQRLSARVDALEKKQSSIETLSRQNEIVSTASDGSSSNDSNQLESMAANNAIGEMLHILGASLLWLVALVGLDQFATGRELMITEAYPAELLIWSVGSCTWVFYLLFRLGKSGLRIPMLIRVQAALAVGITTLMGVMLNDDSMTTVSNVWTWGTILSIALLLASSMLTTAWRSTKRLVGIKETIEIID